MDVGGDRQAGLRANVGEDLQAGGEAGAAEGVDARAVRLVERRLEDELDVEGRGDSLQLFGDVEGGAEVFEDAGAGDPEQRLTDAALIGSDAGGIVGHGGDSCGRGGELGMER